MFHNIKDYQRALGCFSNVLNKISNDKTVYLARGLVYQDMGNHSKAIDDFSDAIRNDEHLTEGYYYRGLSKSYARIYKEAIEDFQRAEIEEKARNQLEGTHGDEYRNAGIFDGMGRCLHALKNYDDALVRFEDAISLEKNNKTFYMHRA